MKLYTKKILALSLMLSLCVVNIAFAQTATDTSDGAQSSDQTTAPADDSSTVAPPIDDSSVTPSADSSTDASSTQPADTTDDTSSATSSSPDIQGSDSTVQDTTNTQPAVTGDVLEDTADPSAASSTDDTSIPLIDATTTDASSTDATAPLSVPDATTTADDTLTIEQGSSTLDVVNPVDIDASSTTELDTQDTVVDTLAQTPPPAPLPIQNVPPKPEYQFALTGTSMPSKKKIKNPDGSMSMQSITAPLTPQVNNADGSVSVSGQCSDADYVVLLYKNPDDYINNPRSYIVNRAYPCVNGAFSYSISDLPTTLADGTYYLLVGQEGDTGTWTPITDVTEITINRNN